MKQTIDNPETIKKGDVIHYGNSRHQVREVDVIDEMLVPGDDGLETALTAGVRTVSGPKSIEQLMSYERLADSATLTVTRKVTGEMTA